MNMFGTTCAWDDWKKNFWDLFLVRAWKLFMCTGFLLHIFHCACRSIYHCCWSGHQGHCTLCYQVTSKQIQQISRFYLQAVKWLHYLETQEITIWWQTCAECSARQISNRYWSSWDSVSCNNRPFPINIKTVLTLTSCIQALKHKIDCP